MDMTSYERTNKKKKEIINQMEKQKRIIEHKKPVFVDKIMPKSDQKNKKEAKIKNEFYIIKEIKKDIKSLNIIKNILIFIFIFFIITKYLTIPKLLKNHFFTIMGIHIILEIIIDIFIIKRKKIVTTNIDIILKFLIMTGLFIKILPYNKLSLFEFNLSNITLKVKGIGYSHILGNEGQFIFDKKYYPNEVYINGIKQNEINYAYYLNQTDNIVELFWNHNNINCR